MRTEREIRDKIESLENMRNNMRDGSKYMEYLAINIAYQIDMCLWMLEDESGLPPIDEDPMYECYK